jgi:hypothetical protein
MKRYCLALATVLMLLAAPQARANWFCGPMDPYPGYGHPSFYFPPAMSAFYAGYGFTSLIPGTQYYTPTCPNYVVAYQTYCVTKYQPVYVPCPGPFCTMQWSCVMVPYQATVTVPVYVPCP